MLIPDRYFEDSVVNWGFVPTAEDLERAATLCERVNNLMDAWGEERDLTSGHRTREKTLAMIAKGYRAAVGGQHEQSNAVDLEDPEGELDRWITDGILEIHDLYREHPDSTKGWVHLQTTAPRSGHRTFLP